ncbi:hypothetical protein ILUMI_24908 [Ignelater luminosus]|uniref:Transposase Tc1-like domain-containing protein n=1 Tax=Ignelater luminosus TaxID=2038154 RepID=A0A8K0G0F9_IGNLU|nr:hypothetical protein ILUMI_24908 [Ignelater luminosus]
MPKIRELSENECDQIFILHREKRTQVEIAQLMKCSRFAVQLAIKRYQDTDLHKTKPRTGRPKVTTTAQGQFLKINYLKDKHNTSSDLRNELSEAMGADISSRTVRRHLQGVGLKGCKARRKPWLSMRNKKGRLVWAKNHKDWIFEHWTKVVWSDECNIEVRII